MNHLLALPILLPLAGAALSTVVGRSRLAQRIIGVVVLSAVTVISIVLAVAVDDRGIVVAQSGGWRAPLGITLVLDRTSAMMLAVASVTLLAVLLYAIGHPGADNHHVGFQSVYLVLAAGVGISFVTGDMFTLFVGFEVMLTASYVLITLGGTHPQVRSGMTYVVISLLASALFITALAFLYSATGTVNMADLAGRMADLPHGVRSAFAALLLVVFGIKAALFPLFFWLPDSYPTAPSPVTAVFAGLLTKVGVYAMIRTQTLLFPADSRPSALHLGDGRGDHDHRHPGCDRPGRRQADPVVQHRQPHRLHGHGPRLVQRGRTGRRAGLHVAPHRRDDDAVPHRWA